MSTISNRFFITALDDGTTLHGNLVSTKSLTQGWNGTAAVPNWRTAQSSEKPIVFLTLMSGNTYVEPTSVSWYYDGALINFNAQDISSDGKFQRTTYTLQGLSMPALKIIDNIADSSDVDVHTIMLSGTYAVSSGVSISFSVTTQIRITTITANSYFGIIDFVDGKSNFTEKGENITMYASLYGSGSDSEMYIADYNVVWSINGVVFNSADYPHSSGIGNYGSHWALTLNEADVTDSAIIKCSFTLRGESSAVYNAYSQIDDLQDPEYLYIQYNKTNGSSATLRSGEQVMFVMWVGSADDPTPITSYNSYSVLLLDSEGKPIMNSLGSPSVTGMYDADEDGWRQLLYETKTGYTGRVAWCKINYDIVSTYGKNITGIVKAEQT